MTGRTQSNFVHWVWETRVQPPHGEQKLHLWFKTWAPMTKVTSSSFKRDRSLCTRGNTPTYLHHKYNTPTIVGPTYLHHNTMHQQLLGQHTYITIHQQFLGQHAYITIHQTIVGSTRFKYTYIRKRDRSRFAPHGNGPIASFNFAITPFCHYLVMHQIIIS